MGKKTFMAALLISAFLISSIVVIHVNLAKADNPKTITVPDDYPTMQVAVAHASSGDTVFVRKGNYDGGIALNKPISLKGEDAMSTIIVGGATLSDLSNTSAVALTPASKVTTLIEKPLMLTDKTTPNFDVQTATLKIQPANFIPPMTFGIYINSSDVTISGFTIMGGTRGIYGNGDRLQINQNILGSCVLGGSNITVANNSRMSLQIGGFNNLVAGNNGYLALVSSNSTILENALNGFLIENANSNVIANNTVSGANEGMQIGYSGKTSSYNIFLGNTIENSGICGIILVDGAYNVFFGNTVKNTGAGIGHDGYGLALGGTHIVAENNLFFHNSFVNNSKNFGVNWQVNGKNYFDNGQEGNYWDDYLVKYPNASEAGQTGTGNTPYLLIGENMDNHPFLKQPDVPGKVSALPEPWASLLPKQTPIFTPSPSPSPSIPEFPTWITLLLITAATVLTTLFIKRKLASNLNPKT